VNFAHNFTKTAFLHRGKLLDLVKLARDCQCRGDTDLTFASERTDSESRRGRGGVTTSTRTVGTAETS
jgi:hypothetical protein